MLGVFSEYERAKIIERTTRGRLHRLRMGEMSSTGHRIYGYHYVRKTATAFAKLRGCIEGTAGLDDRSTARELARVARKIGALDQERRQLIDRYAADQMKGEEYIAANRALDEKLERRVREKAKLAAALRSPQQEDFVDASIRQFCAAANAHLQACSDFDDKRQFLVGHVERVIYERYNVKILGSVPIQSASGETKLPFRIEGKIDIKAVRSESCRKAALETMRALTSDTSTAAAQALRQPVLSPLATSRRKIRRR
jgi:hypothetical protein